jgi:GNAT superfamily N-acetyltransferase
MLARSSAPRALTEIRPYRRGDAEALMPLFRELWSEEVITLPGLAHWIEEQPKRAAMQAWVAEEDGALVAFANARFRWALEEPGIAGLWVGVLPTHRRRGLGTSMYELAEAHLADRDARRLGSTVREDEADGRAFAKGRGYRETRREQYWALEIEPDAALPRPPDGVEVVRLTDVLDRERDLFELYDAAERDMPDDHVHTMEFDDWKRDTLDNPELDSDLSAVVLVGDRPASFSWLISDRAGRRAMNEMTGTAPGFRRRGFARLAKEMTIRWAAELGIERILTSNDSTNTDMLALNEHLGYRPSVLRLALVKDL